MAKRTWSILALENFQTVRDFFGVGGFGKKEGSYSVAVIFIILGFILLFNNFGIIPWNIWTYLWRFWPVILIVWGLQVVLGETRIARILMILITFLVCGYVLSIIIAKNNPQFRDYLNSHLPGWDISANDYSNSSLPMDEFDLDQ